MLPPKEETPKHCDVYPPNHDAVRVFLAVQNQWDWIVGAKAMRTNLKYSSIESAMNMMGIEDTASAFEGVRVIEAEVLSIWSKRSD